MTQLWFDFRKGTNRKPPRLERGGYVLWCGYCKHDHTYRGAHLTAELVAAMHLDKVQNLCAHNL